MISKFVRGVAGASLAAFVLVGCSGAGDATSEPATSSSATSSASVTPSASASEATGQICEPRFCITLPDGWVPDDESTADGTATFTYASPDYVDGEESGAYLAVNVADVGAIDLEGALETIRSSSSDVNESSVEVPGATSALKMSARMELDGDTGDIIILTASNDVSGVGAVTVYFSDELEAVCDQIIDSLILTDEV